MRCAYLYLPPPHAPNVGEVNSICLPDLLNWQYTVHRTRPISFAIEGYVLESESLKYGHESCGHLGRQCAGKIVACDLNANDFAVMSYPGLFEAKFSECILTGFDRRQCL